MNYRHAYHAGNFADCLKHALLVALLDTFARKSTPYFVLDTHAGAGWYDLGSDASRRTGEADDGIRRLLHSPSPILSRYLGLVTQLGLYPGSPALIQAMLRNEDRLVCCELHPEDVLSLKGRFRRDKHVEVHARCGWEALGSLLPPRERRGLVFVDSPFEARDEFFTLEDGLRRGHRRFASGVFAGWYPIKNMSEVRSFRTSLAATGVRDIIDVELHLRHIANPDRLSGCGMVVINPPYQFLEQAGLIANAVLHGLGNGGMEGRTAAVRLVDE